MIYNNKVYKFFRKHTFRRKVLFEKNVFSLKVCFTKNIYLIINSSYYHSIKKG